MRSPRSQITGPGPIPGLSKGSWGTEFPDEFHATIQAAGHEATPLVVPGVTVAACCAFDVLDLRVHLDLACGGAGGGAAAEISESGPT